MLVVTSSTTFPFPSLMTGTAVQGEPASGVWNSMRWPVTPAPAAAVHDRSIVVGSIALAVRPVGAAGLTVAAVVVAVAVACGDAVPSSNTART